MGWASLVVLLGLNDQVAKANYYCFVVDCEVDCEVFSGDGSYYASHSWQMSADFSVSFVICILNR